ncbi:MAG: imidazole glycerol phosphate synthase subunit HisH [Candidatus Bathyarchaeia archaeon]
MLERFNSETSTLKLKLVKVVVFDYAVGNFRSIKNGLEKSGAEVSITSEIAEIEKADALVFPGVGAFPEAIRRLNPAIDTIKKFMAGGGTLLGICLGMQLLFTVSTEGGLYKGLDYFKGIVVKLPSNVKIPHIGWNTIEIRDFGCPLLDGVPDGSFLYFVHSYYAKISEVEIDSIDAETTYGVVFPSVVSKGSVFATQFHPERSGKIGLRILKNFIEYIKR